MDMGCCSIEKMEKFIDGLGYKLYSEIVKGMTC